MFERVICWQRAASHLSTSAQPLLKVILTERVSDTLLPSVEILSPNLDLHQELAEPDELQS